MQLDGSDVLLEPMQLGRAGNWHDPGLLSEQPGECDLSGRGFLALGHLTQQIHYRLIGFPRFWRKTRNDVAEIVSVEICFLVDCARQETFAERTERYKANAQFFQSGQYLLFRLAPPE